MVCSNEAGGTDRHSSDTYIEAMTSVANYLRAAAPDALTPHHIVHFAEKTARSIRDSSETLEDDVKMCRLAAVDGTRQFLVTEGDRLQGRIGALSDWVAQSHS